ncbi:hypothetical protein [Streptomyces sp. NPDC001083]|uniref:hypothetical protein n=1 Tax=Streptomyces sp. NPDC001083 TaxID=3364545 RepID=UPI0036C62081
MTVHHALERDARHAGQTPERYIHAAIHRALAEHTAQETDRLKRAVRQLLAHTNPAHLIATVGHALTHLPESSRP